MKLPEILLVDKPAGITSFGVIRELRRKTGVRKFGHAGTLDPLATGLMILGVEQGTKRLAELIKLDKEYVAKIRLGERRTTDDLEGEVVEECEVSEEIPHELLLETVAKMVGTHALPVSAYSAIKKEGVPLYKKARTAQARGSIFTDVPTRNMLVYEATLLSANTFHAEGKKRFEVTVRFAVASGVYIRSLAVYFGSILGYPATLSSLRRTKIGAYTVENAYTLDKF